VLIYWDYIKNEVTTWWHKTLLPLSFKNSTLIVKWFFFCLLIFSLNASAQGTDSLKQIKSSLKVLDTIKKSHSPVLDTTTTVNGRITNALTGQPIPNVNVAFTGSSYSTISDSQGKFFLSARGSYKRVSFSFMGAQSLSREIRPNRVNELQIHLKSSQRQLQEVRISAGKRKKYRNKGNPAVELIQEIIDHKNINRMQSADYLQYDQYERIGLSFFHLSPEFINSSFFSKYKFMLDTTEVINGEIQTSLPVFFSEKLSENYFRKKPSKSIKVLQAQKELNIIKFVDTVGVNIYINRIYGDNIDIYENNIFIITNQFLSPIANHAPDFYKFFIADTIKIGNEKFIEVNFTPRNKGDLLFEGKLLVTMDGRYAVKSCELDVNRQININFMRSLKIVLDFQKHNDGRYYLNKSDVKADFGIFKDRGLGVIGERTVFRSNYKLNSPLSNEFYKGKDLQIADNVNQPDTTFWLHHRTDTLSKQQGLIYTHINKLENMRSFKRATWIASTITNGFADLGPVQIGQLGSTFAFNNQEGIRFQAGARTTPEFNKTVYLDGYTAYGTKDATAKYDLNTYFSLNKTAPYRFPNDYFKIGYLYDVSLPGEDLAAVNTQATLTSFSTGKNDYWLYNKIFNLVYVKDFENHFSYNLGFENWNQQAAGTLLYQLNDADHTIVHNLTTSEVDLGLRYAPHEQIIQGSMVRFSIYSKYPIIALQINHGIAGFLGGSYNYNNITTNITKRFYFSQLGYSDVAVLGGLITGKVPFPLLDISPANRSIAYDPNAYNQMGYLEFVSDHYVGLNFTQSFNGFFLNKIPLIDHLKWREYFSFKVLYGGLRNENNPAYSSGLYKFPVGGNGTNGTYALGNVPYIEGGVGIGNIYKIIRVDLIKRFNYLDHPGIGEYGVKISFNPDF
jgi:hypothetical protein